MRRGGEGQQPVATPVTGASVIFQMSEDKRRSASSAHRGRWSLSMDRLCRWRWRRGGTPVFIRMVVAIDQPVRAGYQGHAFGRSLYLK